ncbi:MAG TPA: tRNA lysidine(34) synthetase TilS [Lachnospiraceae bacterium]|nr:tRNA lysidine(34) synthetase TilS [Lachnospiraceae bacterium]
MKNRVYLKIKKFIEKNNLIQYGDKIVTGVSGGADSVLLFIVLAELAAEYCLKICAVHINHGIRGEEALRDEQFTAGLVSKYGFDCRIFHKDIPALASRLKLTEEEAGRRYRYECFESVRKELDYDKIAVAHHKDDQAETVIFQLVRGSGIKGLGGMKPSNGNIIRPLLDIRRSEIEETLNIEGQVYCIDSTNADTGYARNRIRNDILPYIAENIQPAVIERLAATAAQLRDVYSYIGKQAAELYADIVKEEDGYCSASADLLAGEDKVMQREVLMYMAGYVAGRRKDITSRHIELLESLLDKHTGKRISLPYGMCAGMDYGRIWIKKADLDTSGQQGGHASVSTVEKIDIKVPGSIELEYNNREKHIILFKREHINLQKFSDIIGKNYCTKCFDYDKIKFMPQFRHPLSSDYMWLRTDGSRKKLSRILIDSKIPANERSRLWVLAERNHILWIPSMGRCSAYYYVTDGTKEVLYAKIIKEEEKN